MCQAIASPSRSGSVARKTRSACCAARLISERTFALPLMTSYSGVKPFSTSTPIFDFGRSFTWPTEARTSKARPEVLLDGLRLGGRLDDDEARARSRPRPSRRRFPSGPAFAVFARRRRLRRLRGGGFGSRASSSRRSRLLRSPSSLSPSSVVPSGAAQKVVARALLAQSLELQREQAGERGARRRVRRRARPRRRAAASAERREQRVLAARRAPASGELPPAARPSSPSAASTSAAGRDPARRAGGAPMRARRERIAHVARHREHGDALAIAPSRR